MQSVEPSAELLSKRDRLLEILRSYDSAAVAFSGGIDSTVVAKAATLTLRDRAVAVTADSPSVARSELEDARRLVAEFVTYYNTVRLHSAIAYITPADKLAGRAEAIWAMRREKSWREMFPATTTSITRPYSRRVWRRPGPSRRRSGWTTIESLLSGWAFDGGGPVGDLFGGQGADRLEAGVAVSPPGDVR